MSYRLIVLSTGYVESNSIARTFWVNDDCADETEREALSSLAHQLFEFYWNECQYDARGDRACCKDFRTRDPSWRWCPQCRSPLRPTVNFEHFITFITQINGMTADGTGSLEDYGPWWAWVEWERIRKIPYKETIGVSEWGAEVLLFSLNPERLNELGNQFDIKLPLGDHWKKYTRGYYSVKTDEEAIKKINAHMLKGYAG